MVRLFAPILLVLVALPVFAQDEKKDAPAATPLYTKLAEPMPVGDFTLEERGGQQLRNRDLPGKIWVVQFFYPGCNLCSKNTPTMVRLQELVQGKDDVRLLSIDLWDVKAKTLREYADTYGADPKQWLFVTGPEDKVHDMVRLSFYTLVLRNKNPSAGDMISHRTDLWLLDWQGNMVGYVDGTKEGAADALKEEIDRLRIRRRLEERIPVQGSDLPWFNAMLNSTCTILLLLGWIAIRLRYETLHKIAMLLALAVSMVFLASYLFYHFAVMQMEPTRFRGEGTVRYVYFAILLSHTILAILVAPLAIYIAIQGLRDARLLHKKVARWTLPIWLYVSVTGVVVYWMLYRIDW